MTSEIVKVQRPHYSNMPITPGRCLVYGKDNKHVREQIVSAECWNALMNDVRGKGFFFATWTEANGGSWDIEAPAPWQEW